MFYLASSPKGAFIFYFEEGRIPYSSEYGSVAFPAKLKLKLKRPPIYSFNELSESLAKFHATIIDSDPAYYVLLDRHPECLI